MIDKVRKLKRKSNSIEYVVELGFNTYKKYLEVFKSGKRVHNTSGGFKMRMDVTESSPMLGRKLGTYEESISSFIEEGLDKDSIYVDIGANKGYHALEAAGIVGNGQVLAFEPNPENVKDIEKNIKINNLKNIQTISKALSDTEGEVDFYLGNMSGTGSIKNQEKDPEMTVETMTFDKYMENQQIDRDRIDVVKIDVEGAELQVLEGMRGFLSEVSTSVVVEFHSSELSEEEFYSKLQELDLKIKYSEDNFYFLES